MTPSKAPALTAMLTASPNSRCRTAAKRYILLAAQPVETFVPVGERAALAALLTTEGAAAIGAVASVDGGWSAQ